MTATVDGHRLPSEVPHPARQSLYDRVMADPDTRRAYLNTTQGTLTGNPAHQDMEAILRVLDVNKIVYLYDPDTNRPRPTFYSSGRISIGLAEISLAAEKIAVAS